MPSTQYDFNTGNATTGNPRAASFCIPEGVEVYGGFAGSESVVSLTPANLDVTLANRNLAANASILNGDIGILDDILDNASHVVSVL